jgi:GNAT superfamily N-acetyltransferase
MGAESSSGANSTEFSLRPATVGDAPVLAYQRRAMFEAIGSVAPTDGPVLEEAVRGYIERAMPAGTFYAWVVECSAGIVAGGGLQLRTLMPRPGYVAGEPEGLIVSMWTEPDFRRRGLGRRVLEAMLAWAEERGIRRLTLHASDDGRPLYSLYGFTPTNEMRLELDPPSRA